MTMRLYNKSYAQADIGANTTTSYTSDGQGQVVEGYVKVFTNTDQINNADAIQIQLLPAKGSQVTSFTVNARNDAGLDVTAASIATSVLGAGDPNKNTLTVTLGADLPANSTLTVFYTAA